MGIDDDDDTVHDSTMVQVILKYFDQVLALGASRITWEVCHLHNSCLAGIVTQNPLGTTH